MKKLMILVVCAVMAVCLAACEGKVEPSAKTGVVGEENVQIPSPFVDFKTLAEAEEAAGFEMTVPESMDGKQQSLIQAAKSSEGDSYDMIQVFYGSESEICIRKGKGSEDISGNYEEYQKSTSLDINGIKVSARGNDEKIYVAVWTDGGYTYSIDAQGGLDTDTVTAAIAEVR